MVWRKWRYSGSARLSLVHCICLLKNWDLKSKSVELGDKIKFMMHISWSEKSGDSAAVLSPHWSEHQWSRRPIGKGTTIKIQSIIAKAIIKIWKYFQGLYTAPPKPPSPNFLLDLFAWTGKVYFNSQRITSLLAGKRWNGLDSHLYLAKEHLPYLHFANLHLLIYILQKSRLTLPGEASRYLGEAPDSWRTLEAFPRGGRTAVLPPPWPWT